jgi:hypothetical protein
MMASIARNMACAIDSSNVTDWETQGYPSKKAASLIASIADPSTNAVSRKSLCKELLHGSADDEASTLNAPTFTTSTNSTDHSNKHSKTEAAHCPVFL